MKWLFNVYVAILITLSFLIGSQLAPAQDLPPEEPDILLEEPLIPDYESLNNTSAGTEALVTERMSQWEVFPICTEAGHQYNPSVSGNIVVWHDYRSSTTGYDIYGYDLTTEQEFPICTEAGDQRFPSVSGDIVVWYDYRSSTTGCDICGYDLTTEQEFPICTEAGHQYNPSVSGNIVVWHDYRSSTTGCDIYGYDLTTEQEFPICTEAGDQYYPSVSGNIVVWIDYRNYLTTGCDIYGYHLTTEQEFPICTEAGYQYNPSVSGNIVVWMDYTTIGYDIYGYDLTTEQEFPICTEAESQYYPSVSGNIVVWVDYRNHLTTGYDIYGYDLTTEQEFPICTEAGYQYNPSVSGNTIVWHDYRSSTTGWDIYGARPLTPAEMLTQLLEKVGSLNLDKGIANSLGTKIDAASRAINDLNGQNDVAAINALQAFINAVEAQRGKRLSDEEANLLVNYANQIIGLLGGGENTAPSMIRTAPADFLLSQNYPNPFNPDTWIPYRLPHDAGVIIRIYSVTGRLIRTLNLGYKPAGLYVSKSGAAYWDGTDEAGQAVPSGIYFYFIQAGEYTTTKKMIIAR